MNNASDLQLVVVELQTYYCRLQVGTLIKGLEPHRRVVQELGIDSMSSDESDIKSGNPVGDVKSKIWRNQNVTHTFRDMDSIHLSLQTTTAGWMKRGNVPCIHRETAAQCISTKGPVGGFSHTCYDTTWLASLSITERQELEVRKESVDLSFSDDVTEVIFN
ncbi:hypothetical protein M422DRAFT_257416 [Sphaerobolus stellatus SS14]|uniref:Unplaced genomic scaffold SPHSTscaffold_74, whole genome shotgun sequence n=1 Tax=Sphaerobolus stellatus (strain SS14) TaxID=990650 RepID=A0A0C9VEJ4_SPHS4|nr:hypothetical protein M422DRAFT_257416 [Sphaerobolus stellatus SS14]